MKSLPKATNAAILQKRTINFRLILVCIAAASVGLPIAIISIAKMLLFIGGVAVLLGSRTASPANELRRTSIAVLIVLSAFAISLVWSTAPEGDALISVGKYGKLLMIPLIVMLIKDRREAVYALGIFSLVQLFLLIGSWMLFLHLPVPWATSSSALTYNSVFSSYLDQGIMTAVFAAICWHLRLLVPGKFGQYWATTVAVIALANVFFVLEGRSGHLVAILMLSLAIMWALPSRYRVVVVLLPVLLLLAVATISPTVQTRIVQVKTEMQAFSFQRGENITTGSSSGIRLHFWHRAVQSMTEHPAYGSGVGSWSSEFNRIEKLQDSNRQVVAALSNPHQEYLQWGVQLGIPGVLLLAGLMISVLRDTLEMETVAARAVQSALVALAAACLFNSTLYDALIGDFFCVTLGLLLAFGLHGNAKVVSGPALHSPLA